MRDFIPYRLMLWLVRWPGRYRNGPGDSYGLAMEMREARADLDDSIDGEKLCLHVDTELVVNLCVEAVAMSRKARWRIDAQKKLEGMLDGRAEVAQALLEWVRQVGEIWYYQQIAARNVRIRSCTTAVASVLFLVATVIFGLLRELG